ncbi:uncharacterized protein LOC131301533 [Rhododendron vialii]|uniref:uncharacterized protein LOC131301533 n=1 Tax=Rhododendron vialii TaxID=182163 RepID=UPI00265E8B83|nr:uncharacterized protein LOC131301533 [Rhododendron vialii]
MFCSPHTVVGCLETPAIPSRTSQNLKHKRGLTKLKTIPIDESSRIDVKFDENGEPIGEGSVKLSSFLGPLVREIVPYTLLDWRKLPSGMPEILWQSIQVKSENFKAMREKQLELQLTMSRKGYARLTTELKAKRNVASISRAIVWADGHREKNGKPKNKNVAQKIVYGLIKKCCCDFLQFFAEDIGMILLVWWLSLSLGWLKPFC